ncbi:MAG: hypothetical protein R3F20_19125 [Planctomycetota bacterium]
MTAEGDFHKAEKELDKAEKSLKDAPEVLTAKVKAAREANVAAAQKALDDIVANQEPAQAKRALNRLIPKLKGTGLEEKAREALVGLKDD